MSAGEVKDVDINNEVAKLLLQLEMEKRKINVWKKPSTIITNTLNNYTIQWSSLLFKTNHLLPLPMNLQSHQIYYNLLHKILLNYNNVHHPYPIRPPVPSSFLLLSLMNRHLND